MTRITGIDGHFFWTSFTWPLHGNGHRSSSPTPWNVSRLLAPGSTAFWFSSYIFLPPSKVHAALSSRSDDILPVSTTQPSAQFSFFSQLPSPNSCTVIALINTRSQSYKSRADLSSAFRIFNDNTGYHKADSNRDLKLEPFLLHFPARLRSSKPVTLPKDSFFFLIFIYFFIFLLVGG